MANFNTNQTRHFYVANAVDSSVDTALDIAVAQAQTGEFFFKYMNADGLLTRSDTINPKNVLSVKKTAAADMARKLKKHTVAVNTSAVTLASLVGKTVECIITLHGQFDYDMANGYSIVATVTGDSTNTANATAFHKALAEAIAKALPPRVGGIPVLKVFSNGTEVLPTTPASSITGASAGVVLVEAVQKYVRGKLNGEPIPFSVAFRYEPNNYEEIVWGTDTIADSDISNNTVMPANYVLADLEWFALGERGDVYREAAWPDNYETTYVIAPNGATNYDVLTIEYFWAGNAENVQKSPRMIQIAGKVTGSGSGASSPCDSLYTTVMGYINGTASGSGSGSGSGA